jgi:hypothetical protein
MGASSFDEKNVFVFFPSALVQGKNKKESDPLPS